MPKNIKNAPAQVLTQLRHCNVNWNIFVKINTFQIFYWSCLIIFLRIVMPQNYILLSKRGHFWLATYVMSGLIWLGKGTSREIEKIKDNMVLLDLNGLSVWSWMFIHWKILIGLLTTWNIKIASKYSRKVRPYKYRHWYYNICYFWLSPSKFGGCAIFCLKTFCLFNLFARNAPFVGFD